MFRRHPALTFAALLALAYLVAGMAGNPWRSIDSEPTGGLSLPVISGFSLMACAIVLITRSGLRKMEINDWAGWRSTRAGGRRAYISRNATSGSFTFFVLLLPMLISSWRAGLSVLSVLVFIFLWAVGISVNTLVVIKTWDVNEKAYQELMKEQPENNLLSSTAISSQHV
jgi:hypothetical protein